MREEKGISKIALILIVVLVLVIGAVATVLIINKNKESESLQEYYDDLYEDEIEEDDTEYVFWLNTIDWSKTGDNSVTSLYNEKISLPIKLEDLDVCSAPYSFWPDGFNQTNADTIQEILKSTTEISAGRETEISTQSKFVDGSWKDYNEVPDNISWIYIKNYTESDSTTAECYNNGWWHISHNYNPAEALGIDMDDIHMNENGDYHEDWDERLLFDEIINKMGAPTYVRMRSGDSDTLKINEGFIIYEMVYEYDEYTIEFVVSEGIMKENNSYISDCSGPTYYTKECWEKEKNKITSEEEIIKK